VQANSSRTVFSALPVATQPPVEALPSPDALSGLASGELPSLVATVADISPETAGTIAAVLGPVFAVGTLLMVIRIVTTWYPQIEGGKLPWVLVFLPTEWLLVQTRKVVPPQFGVDVSPIVWVAVISFLNEILLGPQGILNLIQREQLAGM
jgi:YggT family protein